MKFTSLSFAVVAVLGVSTVAQAQTFTGTIPGPQSPSTWNAPPVNNCNGATSSRAYTAFTFTNIGAAGNYTFTASRASGSGLSLYLFQNSFDPTFACLNFWTNGSTTAGSSTALTTALTTYNSSFVLVISGNSAADVANVTLTVTGPQVVTATCGSSALSPTSITNVPGAGSTTSVSYTPAFGCSASWTSSGVPAWITGVPASGSGPATFNLVVAANTGGARNATITIGGRTIFVSQQAQTCTYTLTSSSASVGSGGSTGSMTINTTPTCAWTATSNATFLTGLSATSGMGTTTVTFTIGANNGIARSGTLTFGGQTYTVNQANGCTYSVTPATNNVAAAGQSGVTVVVSPSNAACPWNAASNSAFITNVSPTSGTGTLGVAFDVAATTGPARSGTLTIAGQTITVNQASGCTYTLASSTQNAGSGATTGSVMVNTTAGCTWTASSGASWVNSVNPTSSSGPGTVTWSVDGNTGPARTTTLTIAGQTYTVNQANGCTYSLSASSQNAGASATSGSVTVNTSPGCTWTAASGASWVNSVSPVSSSGTGTVSYAVDANSGPSRSATMTIAGQTYTVNQANGCTYSLSSSSAGYSASSGSGGVTVNTAPGCTWTASSSVSWVNGVAPTMATGAGIVSYSVDANSGPARSGSMTIAGQTYTVNQLNGCTYSLTSSSQSYGSGASGGSVTVNTGAGCTWTAVSNDSWVNSVNPTSSSGTGSVSYAVDGNTGPARNGTITIAGQTFSVAQADGCTYSVDTTTFDVGASGVLSATTNVSTSPGCGWSVSSGLAWVTNITPASSSGSGAVTFDIGANVAPARSGSLTVAGTTVSIAQDDGCTYSVSPLTVGVGAAGQTSASVDVTASDSQCTWTAASNDGFITGVSPTASMGTLGVTFDVDANTAPARSGTLTIAGSTVTIDQADGCTYSLSASSSSVGNGAGSGSVDVTTDAACAWSATSNDGWLTNVSATASMGSGTVTFDIDANTSPSRSGTITVGGQTYTVSQADGCTFTVTPSVSVAAAGQTGVVVSVTTGAGCAWTASENLAYVQNFTPTSSTGTGDVTFDVDANAGPARNGAIIVAGTAVSIDQSTGCTYTLDQSNVSVPVTGQSGVSVTLTTGAGCAWTASTTASHVQNFSASSGTGSATLTFDVAANAGPARNATVTIGGQTVTAAQAEGCDFTLTANPTNVSSVGGSTLIVVDATDAQCTFDIASDSSWAVLSHSSESGDKSYVVTVDANTAAARDATFSLTGATGESETVVVSQTAAGVGLDAGMGTDSGMGGGADAGPDAGDPTSIRGSGGCACTVAGGSRDHDVAGLVLAGLVMLALVVRRRALARR